MSKDRSPRGSWRTTMGTRRATVWLLMAGTVACNPMVARDITLPVDPDEAWDCLTEPEQLEEWFAERAELELREGGTAAFTLPGGERRRGRRRGGRARRAPGLLVVGAGARGRRRRARRAGLARRVRPRRRARRDAHHRPRGRHRAARAGGDDATPPGRSSPRWRTARARDGAAGGRQPAAAATATELAADLPVTRQAVAKHLAVLAGAGLVAARREGRETRYRPTPAPLGEAIGWMTGVGAQWDERARGARRAHVARRAERARGRAS